MEKYCFTFMPTMLMNHVKHIVNIPSEECEYRHIMKELSDFLNHPEEKFCFTNNICVIKNFLPKNIFVRNENGIFLLSEYAEQKSLINQTDSEYIFQNFLNYGKDFQKYIYLKIEEKKFERLKKLMSDLLNEPFVTKEEAIFMDSFLKYLQTVESNNTLL